MKKVLVIGLDGCELSLADIMINFRPVAFACKDPREKCEIFIRS